ncbi:MAG: helix-turn-helix domain-containing protein, partial [Snowella sp.]
MLNVLKVRIYPNKEQELALAKNFGCVRFVWNYYLNKTNNQYLEMGKGLCDENQIVVAENLNIKGL